MFRIKPGPLTVLICLIAAASFCLLMTNEIQAQDGSGAKKGKGIRASAIFVQGHYAFLLDSYVTDPSGINSWLHIIEIEDDENPQECQCLHLHQAKDVFVGGQFMYIATDAGLVKYDVSDPCDPESLDYSYSSGGVVTDLYVTGDAAYVSFDPSGVLVWDVSDSLEVPDVWFVPAGSPQGIHVRGPYAYVAAETLDLWIRDINTETDYKVEGPDISEDAYNISFTDSNVSLTYVAGSYLRVLDTTDPEDVSLVGQTNRGGPIRQVVHVTGDWVYRIGNADKVEVYEVDYGNPILHTTYKGPGRIDDIHVVHECYWRGPIPPVSGRTHIFGVYPNADTVALWIHTPPLKKQRIESYRYGDVNEDGIINISDQLLLNYYVVNGYNGVIDNLDAADVNCDGEVNTDDCDYLSEYLWGGGPVPGADCDFYRFW